MSTREERAQLAQAIVDWKARKLVGVRKNADGRIYLIWQVGNRFRGTRR